LTQKVLYYKFLLENRLVLAEPKKQPPGHFKPSTKAAKGGLSVMDLISGVMATGKSESLDTGLNKQYEHMYIK
jgi:hypothetical protein